MFWFLLMVVTLCFGAYIVYAMGRIDRALAIAYVRQDSTKKTETSGIAVYPTLCHYEGQREWLVFDKPLREGDTVYFTPYVENDETFTRGYVKEVLKDKK